MASYDDEILTIDRQTATRHVVVDRTTEETRFIAPTTTAGDVRLESKSNGERYEDNRLFATTTTQGRQLRRCTFSTESFNRRARCSGHRLTVTLYTTQSVKLHNAGRQNSGKIHSFARYGSHTTYTRCRRTDHKPHTSHVPSFFSLSLLHTLLIYSTNNE